MVDQSIDHLNIQLSARELIKAGSEVGKKVKKIGEEQTNRCHKIRSQPEPLTYLGGEMIGLGSELTPLDVLTTPRLQSTDLLVVERVMGSYLAAF